MSPAKGDATPALQTLHNSPPWSSYGYRLPFGMPYPSLSPRAYTKDPARLQPRGDVVGYMLFHRPLLVLLVAASEIQMA